MRSIVLTLIAMAMVVAMAGPAAARPMRDGTGYSPCGDTVKGRAHCTIPRR